MDLSSSLWLCRHAESIWHDGNRYAGSSDIPLSANGRLQAEQLASWAELARPVAVYSSTLSRAVATATPVGERLGLNVQLDARLDEVHFGDAEGLTAAEMDERFPDARRRFVDRPATCGLPGAESAPDAARRSTEALEQIARAHPTGRVLVVTHSTVLRLALCRLLGIDLDDYRRVFPAVRNVSITEIEVGRPAGLLSYNRPTGPLT
jgi:probable phosphoglycerate mutase